MSSFPNYQARISRALRNNVPTKSAVETFFQFKWFTICLMLLFPLYPSLSALGNISETQIGKYDPNSIIFEYIDSEDESDTRVSKNGTVQVDLDLVHTNTIPSVSKEVPETPPKSDISTYKVQENDDIIKIAKKYKIDPEVILWTNNIAMDDFLTVGQVLKIPPITGIIYALRPGETISDIARKYNISSSEILAANHIQDPTRIRDGRKLLLPGVTPQITRQETATVKKAKQDTQVPPPQNKATAAKPLQQDPLPQAAAPSAKEEAPVITNTVQANGLKERYAVKYTGLGRGFVAGNCTWYVARNKSVTWRGNANQWIRNAKKQGVPTGKTPVPGAIIQFSGYGYNSYYGHVGIVNEIQGDKLIISDMNYSGLYKVTVRQISINDKAIDGYIYVD